jgi:hypothetical protein
MTLRAGGEMNKVELDNILLNNQAQPVGDGYIDIIINPSNLQRFLSAIKESDFFIIGVSWWEYCKLSIAEAKFGMGGPKSIYYSGWLAEIPIIDIDHFDEAANIDSIELFIKNKKINNELGNSIEYSEGILWPGLWISTPEEWKNNWMEIKDYSKLFVNVTKIINNWDPLDLISAGAPENEYDIEINDFLPQLVEGKYDVINDSFKKYFGDSFRAPNEDCKNIEIQIKKMMKKEC